MATALFKPGVIASQWVDGEVADDGAMVAIKVQDIDHDFSAPTLETTGDRDIRPVHENAKMVYGTITLTGFLVQSTTLIDLRRLNQQNPGDSAPAPWSLIIRYGASTPTETYTVIVERIRLRVRKNAPVAAVAVICRVTDTAPILIGGTA